jgi:hypothetical protein
VDDCGINERARRNHLAAWHLWEEFRRRVSGTGLTLLDMSADIRAFIAANEAQLKAKD